MDLIQADGAILITPDFSVILFGSDCQGQIAAYLSCFPSCLQKKDCSIRNPPKDSTSSRTVCGKLASFPDSFVAGPKCVLNKERRTSRSCRVITASRYSVPWEVGLISILTVFFISSIRFTAFSLLEIENILACACLPCTMLRFRACRLARISEFGDF